ncbi:MAG: thiosulfate oxidation carrier protein SoxY [Sterolibacteriaceae bacterium]|mgnify:CR=1 FL=1|uniref:Thiosulfate oxidation carrier protein SoxY n=1 Tax=Candidatus Methylophosphatis roskildensis TaxID=2899263 RepID=A0A9D7HM45_9PROT|nr:thiosulfate oxidation carrier protein SoxY [Candidatus Methylophosphatis roskildensis]MBK7236828.1 thiosulfate oxidation carrier protein SoxY [Sterolibacteriaceae bacterium]MBK7664836.1 thiosulfate oxidation carrier protein SoxY [Sterolibacteriaceae bacterium]MBK9085101.1 thiosulfate oxidation carrier protein SoxY [Sterolibacteriaceae bacterium]
MNPLRRLLLKGAGASSALLAAIAAGALKPGEVLAADWNAAAFEANNIAAALAAMGIVDPVESADVFLKAPDIAEDSAVVPIEVSSKVANTQKLSVFIDKNPTSLAAHFDLAGGALPSLGLRVKMQQTSRIRVVAHAGGKFYFTTKEVQVTIGGCGG